MKKIFSLILAATLFLGCAVMTNADETDTEAVYPLFQPKGNQNIFGCNELSFKCGNRFTRNQT